MTRCEPVDSPVDNFLTSVDNFLGTNVVFLTLIGHNGVMSYIPANYDNWLTKPYDDLHDADEVTVEINCADQHWKDGEWECDYVGEAEAVLTESEKGRGWWLDTYEGECPKCGEYFTVTKGDTND